MLREGDTFLIGHNLDMPYEIPGMIVINKRGVLKTNISWHEISTSRKPSSPSIRWTSKYGSVTFNPLGREFPDGGINEAGLYLQEMTLSETQFPEDDKRPRMFMMQWMQFQLDNYETVRQVLDHLPEVILDGWSWHFFLADQNGKCACIEFIEGKAVVYTGESMPIPVMCNSKYSDELKLLKQYEGFGGQKKVDLKNKEIPRFVHAAYLIKNFPQTSESATRYGFRTLESMNRGGTQWSYVIDVTNKTAHFRTTVGRQIKYFAYGQMDFSCKSPVKIIDINSKLQNDVLNRFLDYSPSINRQFIEKAVKSIDQDGGFSKQIESAGNTIDNLIETMASYPEKTVCR
ncbi:linear amide C-N hydrolase [Planctomycetota bacterium]